MSSSPPDISQLSESQQEALQTYTSFTDQDPLAAVPLLQRSEWNVQIAITRFFEGEPTSDPVAEAQAQAQAAPAPTSFRQTSNLQFDDLIASVHPPPTARRNANSVDRISTSSGEETQYRPPLILAILFTPFSILYRLLATILSPIGALFPFIPRAIARLAPSQRPRPSRRSLAPADNARRFIREFSEEYGINDLPFVESGFNLALDNAKKDFKFLLVVLLSPSHDDTSSWVRETLLSPQLNTFLTTRHNELLLWGGNVQDAEAYQVADAVQCTKFPFTALLCHTPDSPPSGMTTIMRALGPTSPNDLITKLTTALTTQQPQLTSARLSHHQTQASRTIRQEQDSAYERSLAVDRARARQKRDEAAARARDEKAALAKAQAAHATAQALSQWRRWRAHSLPPEPNPSTSPNSIRLSIRLPSGDRLVRAFPAHAPLDDLYAFVECHHLLLPPTESASVSDPEKAELPPSPPPEGFTHRYQFRLVSPMPRTVYGLDGAGSIAERIGRGGGTLIVEPVEEEEEDQDGGNVQ
jgi:FAS-associated factor 2